MADNRDLFVHPELNEIAKTESPAELWRVVRHYFKDHGFRGLAYFVANRAGPGGSRKGFNVVHHGFSREVTRAYIDEGWGEKDPGPPFVLARGIAMRWFEIWDVIEPDDEQREFYQRMHQAGLGNGLMFPVYGPGGRNGNISVGRMADPAVLDTAPAEEMHIFAQSAHMRLCQLLPDKPALEKPLSARELEILDWVARGKSNSVIADILELSGATVDTYLRRIYDKLDVSDRTSAAVRGVGMGLIAA